MLTAFDWLRRCQNGSDLLATLDYLKEQPDLLLDLDEIGPPLTAVTKPCQRCWIYPCVAAPYKKYCRTCTEIRAKAEKFNGISKYSVIIWASVNRLPKQLRTEEGFAGSIVSGSYVHDEQHFLLFINRRELKPWLQELLLYEGDTLKGAIQVFPSVDNSPRSSTGEILCRVIHQETHFPMDSFRVRFFSSPFQVLYPRSRAIQDLHTFEAVDFLSLLEMATIFRTLLRPETQEMLRQLTSMGDSREKQFYWGRFMGFLDPEAKDMLSAWNIRQWPENKIKLLYELVKYVAIAH
ncbi:MAG: hypothetical protein HQK59_12890 [Deltaproteobacteria bacterium]|nr:hypothetical protein [Deltaproteobacteria bacterium]